MGKICLQKANRELILLDCTTVMITKYVLKVSSLFSQKLYTVCDVALCVINSKSALCNADSPKDPVLPTKFFTQPEKVILTGHIPAIIKPLCSCNKLKIQRKKCKKSNRLKFYNFI